MTSKKQAEVSKMNEAHCPYHLTGTLNDREDDDISEELDEEVGPKPPLVGSIRGYEWAKVLRKMSIRLLRYLGIENMKVKCRRIMKQYYISLIIIKWFYCF